MNDSPKKQKNIYAARQCICIHLLHYNKISPSNIEELKEKWRILWHKVNKTKIHVVDLCMWLLSTDIVYLLYKSKNISIQMLKDVGMAVPKIRETSASIYVCSKTIMYMYICNPHYTS